jgi:serine/threonine protein phosphatase PrpC
MKPVQVESAGLTSTGKQRNNNQDQFLIGELKRSLLVRSSSLGFSDDSRLTGGPLGYFFIVADGMGGHRGGAEASRFALQFSANAILNSPNWTVASESEEESFLERLREIFRGAHAAIEELSKTTPGCEGMGTTLTVAYVSWPKLFIVHAGDTRCYLYRNSELQLITRDHTVANEMIRKGQLAAEDLERSHWSNVLVNALGAGAESVVPDTYKVNLRANDSILLCSDGLNKHVSEMQIGKALSVADDPDIICEQLVEMANQGGGSDNITVVTARFTKLKSPRRRMFASVPTTDVLIQDIAQPESELDTCEIDENLLRPPVNEVVQEKSVKQTPDFFDGTGRATDEFK